MISKTDKIIIYPDGVFLSLKTKLSWNYSGIHDSIIKCSGHLLSGTGVFGLFDNSLLFINIIQKLKFNQK